MLIKFTAKSMRHYQGVNGLGGTLNMHPGDVAEVTVAVGKMLLQKMHDNFEQVFQANKAEHSPKTDKFLRKNQGAKTK
jgi:hypothetical protein